MTSQPERGPVSEGQPGNVRLPAPGRPRKKPVEAHQWFRNGDHPADKCRMIAPDPDSTTQFAPFTSEGEIVRYYRNPDDSGDRVCGDCAVRMHNHGWIDQGLRGRVVCPGDWVVSLPLTTPGLIAYFPVKPDIFAAVCKPAAASPPVEADPMWMHAFRDVHALGTEEEDGAGAGIAADVALLAGQRDAARAKLAQADEIIRRLERITTAWTRGMYSARIDCLRGDAKAAAACLSEGLDGYEGPHWDGAETGAEWWERTKAEEGP